MIGIIIGLAGAIGSGKSFTQLKNALQYANDRNKQLVFNFEINIKELYKYASMPKAYDSVLGGIIFDLAYIISYTLKLLGLKKELPKHSPRLPWIQHLCRTGGIIQIPAPKYLEALLIPESVICLDEAGILLNSREFAKTSKELLADLAQSRKDGCDLLWAAQFEEQVDKQLRLLTQYWIHCDSVSIYDKKFKRPRLSWKRIYWFRAADYMNWLSNVKDRGSHLKARFAYSFQYEGGLLTNADRQLFNVFDSFSRLDKVKNNRPALIVTREYCKLPRDFYFKNLNIYLPELDPMSSKYQPLYGFYFKKVDKKLSENKTDFYTSRTGLIRQALKLSREKGISAPYLKSMSDAEIIGFIKVNT